MKCGDVRVGSGGSSRLRLLTVSFVDSTSDCCSSCLRLGLTGGGGGARTCLVVDTSCSPLILFQRAAHLFGLLLRSPGFLITILLLLLFFFFCDLSTLEACFTCHKVD
jgi:hypothetical protein